MEKTNIRDIESITLTTAYQKFVFSTLVCRLVDLEASAYQFFDM